MADKKKYVEPNYMTIKFTGKTIWAPEKREKLEYNISYFERNYNKMYDRKFFYTLSVKLTDANLNS